MTFLMGRYWDVWLQNMTIQSQDGTVRRLFTGASSFATPWNSCGSPSLNYTVESTATDNSSNTTFYADDHLGSATMEFASGGWPISSTQYAPFGAELPSGNFTQNHFKFTGKERDAESGLDYFGARYYGSNMGRFMSPDWSAKVEPVSYSKLD